jgi:hypothetical protein
MKLRITLCCAAFVFAVLGTFASTLLKSESVVDPNFYYDGTICREIPLLECDDLCTKICRYNPPGPGGYVVGQLAPLPDASTCMAPRCHSAGALN